MRPTKQEVIQKVSRYLSGRREVVFAYLFGSIVDSETFRDVDVGLYVKDAISDGFMYSLAMSDELQTLLRCHVDVIVLNTAPDHLIYSISKGRVVLNREDDARINFITASWSRYFDIQPKRLQAINDMLT